MTVATRSLIEQLRQDLAEAIRDKDVELIKAIKHKLHHLDPRHF